MGILEQKADEIKEPWRHFEIRNFFNDSTLRSIEDLIYNESTDWEKEDREEPRFYYPIRKRNITGDFEKNIVPQITNSENISYLTDISGGHLDGGNLFCHYRLIKDCSGYVKKPHEDLKTLFTLMIFFTKENSGEKYGTEILNEQGEVARDSIYENNAGYFFFTNNGYKTLHSFTKQFTKPRYSLLYNIYNGDDFLSIYEGGSRFNMMGKIRAIRDMEDTLFPMEELL